jgi:predicted amidohydrolase
MKRIIIIVTLLTMVMAVSRAAMAARYVKIATIGARAPQFDVQSSPQQMVDGMIEFWQNQLKQVLPDKPDLIVLPEACDRPAGLNTEVQFKYFQVRKGQIMDYFRQVAKENHCYIAFGTKRQVADGSWRNSLVIIGRDGKTAGIYNKNFPTIGEMEAGIKAGKSAGVIKLDFGTVGGVICFDLNFKELLQQYQQLKPDIILFSSMYHGGLVQSYWAYTSRAFFVSALGFRKSPSQIRNPLGDVIATTTNYFDFVVTTVNLDRRLVHLDYNWEKLRALKDKYGEKVNIYDPGEVGAVMITSEHESVSADDMAEEFDIELLDDYFNRSRAVRKEHLE